MSQLLKESSIGLSFELIIRRKFNSKISVGSEHLQISIRFKKTSKDYIRRTEIGGCHKLLSIKIQTFREIT